MLICQRTIILIQSNKRFLLHLLFSFGHSSFQLMFSPCKLFRKKPCHTSQLSDNSRPSAVLHTSFLDLLQSFITFILQLFETVGNFHFNHNYNFNHDCNFPRLKFTNRDIRPASPFSRLDFTS